MTLVPAPPLCVVHYTGHRMSGAGTHTALVPSAEPAVRDAIASLLDRLNVAAAFGSLASGADTLFAEAFLTRGGSLARPTRFLCISDSGFCRDAFS